MTEMCFTLILLLTCRFQEAALHIKKQRNTNIKKLLIYCTCLAENRFNSLFFQINA